MDNYRYLTELDREDTPLLDAALAYAEHGWPVFPLSPGGKQPLYANPHPRGSEQRRTCRGYAHCGQFGHGVLDATCDLQLIRQLWTRSPRANIGLATGYPGPDVVDVDVKDGAPGMASLRTLIQHDQNPLGGTLAIVRTPSGGIHRYYPARPDHTQANGSLPKLGVDFRGTGGYVVAPPSPTSHGRYRYTTVCDTARPVAFDQIRNILRPPPPPTPRRAWTGRTGEAGHNSADGLLRWYRGQTTGNRNNGLFWAACTAIDRGYPPQVLQELAGIAVAHHRLPPREVDATIGSAQRRVVAA